MRHLKCFLGCRLLTTLAFADDPWRPLFNGKDLSGWETFLSVPDPSWEVAGLKRGTNGACLEPIGWRRDR